MKGSTSIDELKHVFLQFALLLIFISHTSALTHTLPMCIKCRPAYFGGVFLALPLPHIFETFSGAFFTAIRYFKDSPSSFMYSSKFSDFSSLYFLPMKDIFVQEIKNLRAARTRLTLGLSKRFWVLKLANEQSDRFYRVYETQACPPAPHKLTFGMATLCSFVQNHPVYT